MDFKNSYAHFILAQLESEELNHETFTSLYYSCERLMNMDSMVLTHIVRMYCQRN